MDCLREETVSVSGRSGAQSQARAEGGAEGAWAPAPLPKVPLCQGKFFIYLFIIFIFLNTLLWRPAQSNYQ